MNQSLSRNINTFTSISVGEKLVYAAAAVNILIYFLFVQ